MRPDANSRQVAYAYDYLGRRVERRVYSWNGTAWNTTPIEQTRYVWGGSSPDSEVRRYTIPALRGAGGAGRR